MRRVSLALLGALAIAACSDDDNNTGNNNPPVFVNSALVADIGGLGAANTDVNLKNPWGVALNSATGFLWVANNGTGTATVYQPDGTIVSLIVTIPTTGAVTGGKPTGVVYNATTDFVIPSSGAATFLFAGEDGVISGWNQSLGTSAKVVADRSGSGASYKGIALLGGSLFAANFKNNKVDMFDNTFTFVKSFTDANVPAGYGPFNVAAIGNELFVAYAKIDAATGDEIKGAGNGYISVFSSTGTFLRSFASAGNLNAPWAITTAPASFGSFAGAILVGNFGDGKINVFSASDGSLVGTLKTSSGDLSLDGLWGLVVTNSTLFYAAGVQDESHGVFGTITKQ